MCIPRNIIKYIPNYMCNFTCFSKSSCICMLAGGIILLIFNCVDPYSPYTTSTGDRVNLSQKRTIVLESSQRQDAVES